MASVDRAVEEDQSVTHYWMASNSRGSSGDKSEKDHTQATPSTPAHPSTAIAKSDALPWASQLWIPGPPNPLAKISSMLHTLKALTT